jgi:hypothetical protein
MRQRALAPSPVCGKQRDARRRLAESWFCWTSCGRSGVGLSGEESSSPELVLGDLDAGSESILAIHVFTVSCRRPSRSAPWQSARNFWCLFLVVRSA